VSTDFSKAAAPTNMPVQSQLQELIESINRDGLSEPPVELQEFATEETFHQRWGHERRRFRRYSLITNVLAIPLDRELCPVGPPFVALSSGMSVDGMRLIHTEPSPSDHLFIEIEGQPVRFLLSVLRSRPLGPCFEIAGRLTSAAVLSAGSSAMPGNDLGTATLEGSLPSADDLLHWAGVTAAVQLLEGPGTGFGL